MMMNNAKISLKKSFHKDRTYVILMHSDVANFGKKVGTDELMGQVLLLMLHSAYLPMSK